MTNKQTHQHYAVVVGIENYINMAKLPGAASDAPLMAERLRKMGFSLYQNRALTNPSKGAIEDAINDMPLREGDMFLFYFSARRLR